MLKDTDSMPWGKYKGKAMAAVPDEYLAWLLDNNKCYGEVKYYILQNIDAIRINISRKPK